MKRKYLFFDIDGTLTDDNPGGNISQSTLDTLRELEKNGHFVAIATGRSYTLVQEAMKATGIRNVVCNGGNAIVLENELQYIHPLEKDKALIVLHECIDKDIPFAFSINDSLDLYSLDRRMQDSLFGGNHFIIIQPDVPLESYPEFHKLFIGLDKEHEHLIESKKLLGFARYSPAWFIIEPDDKYKGILDLLGRIGGNEEDVVVVGDGYNDLSMAKKAPFSIAMGNAIPELKEVADFVTKDNKHDGIRYACKYFHWID